MTEPYSSFVRVCIALSSIGIFGCDFSPFEYSSVSHSEIRLLLSKLAQVCTAPMLSKSEKILMSLNNKQKPLCQLATAELFPNDTGKQQKNDKSAFGSDTLD